MVPQGASGVALFAHGTGSSRHSPRNRFVARILSEARLATLLTDLLTAQEEGIDSVTRHFRFDILLLAQRLVHITDWITNSSPATGLPIGYFGASTGAAAALVAAVERSAGVRAIVSRGGRPDLAGASLSRVAAPTLLIVGANDVGVIGLNREAMKSLAAKKELVIVPGAGHLFEEPGALEEVTRLAQDWFTQHFHRR